MDRKAFKRWLGLLGAVLFFALSTVLIWMSIRGDKPGGFSLSQPSPRFSLPSFKDGKIFRLDDFKGNEVVIVHFWASWCPPCLSELPELIEFTRKLKDKPVRVLAINLDVQEADAKRVFPKGELPEKFVVLWDPKMTTSEVYGSYQFPETYVLDKDLKLRAKWIGPQAWKDKKYEEAILTLL